MKLLGDQRLGRKGGSVREEGGRENQTVNEKEVRKRSIRSTTRSVCVCV